MDKKYNGFNNGRDKSDGVGGREVNHGTQETMTKEQILEILNNVYRNHMTPGIATRIIHQQLSAERERGQQFPTTEQMDAAIDVSIGKMFGGLEAESIKYFLQTSKINGSFRRRLHDCIKSASMLVDIKAKTELLKERERAGKLIGALNEYIVLLGEELDEVMGFVNAHQWKSTRFEKGEELRQKIKQTLNEYDTATKES